MKHIHQLVSSDLESMLGKYVTVHDKYVQVGDKTVWLGNDFVPPKLDSHHRAVVLYNAVTERLRLFAMPQEKWRTARDLKEEWLASNAVLLYTWNRSDINPNDPLDLPEFVIINVKYMTRMDSYYGAPVVTCQQHGRVLLSRKGKYDVTLSNPDADVPLQSEEVGIVSTSSSGGGHGEGHWDSGFGFEFPFGVVMPRPKKDCDVTIYACAKDVSFG